MLPSRQSTNTTGVEHDHGSAVFFDKPNFLATFAATSNLAPSPPIFRERGGICGEIDGHHDHSHHHVGTLAHDHDHEHEHHHRHGHGETSHDDLRDDLLASIDSQGEDHAHAHNKGDLLLPLIILGGFLFFFVSERIVRGLVGKGSAHSHFHSHGTALNNEAAKRKKDDDHVPDPGSEEPSSFGRDEGRSTKLKIAGILNLAADSLHNCSDGIAIGASFASGTGLGYSTALATLLHELPHEIGDFAVLVQSGMG